MACLMAAALVLRIARPRHAVAISGD
jgi:hypothetical protein